MRCPYCGQPNAENAHNCRRCGKRIDSVRERRKEKGILTRGILLIVLIVAAGIAAMWGIMQMLQQLPNSSREESKVTITSPTPTPIPTEAPEEAGEEPAEAEEQPQESDGYDVRADLVSAEQFAVIRQAYLPVVVSAAEASSTIVQAGIDNSPQTLYDGQDWSGWQDGVDGDGIGEHITFTLDREYQIRGFAVKLGNWYQPEEGYYVLNNRPETLTFAVGNETFSVTFPDEQVEMYVELNHDVPASQVRLTIDSVYKGTWYEDTCISEITIYGI